MATKTAKATKPADTEKAGVTFVSNALQPYSVGNINAKKIYELSENLYISGVVRQMTNLILSGTPKITVYDDKDDVVDDVSRKLNIMFSSPKCNMANCSRSAIQDMFIWGISIYNPVWERKNGELTCSELNHLQSYTFNVMPMGVNSNTAVFGRLLKGIYYSKVDGEIHYTQYDNNKSVEIPKEYLFVMKDGSAQYPDGDSVILPTAPIAEFLNYAWNALGQQMYRTGAPIMFITIQNPQPERRNGSEVIESDVDYANKVLANWGKDTPYVLRENMTISTIEVKEGSLAIVSINKAGETIRDYISPVGMLGKDGTLISGNSNASLRLINNHIKGWVSMIENCLRELPNYYLRGNSYPESWHAEVTIPTTTIEDTTAKYNIASLMSSTKTGTVNEVRELLGFEGISNEEMKTMQEEWNIVSPQSSGFMFSESNVPSKRVREILNPINDTINSVTEDLFKQVMENRNARK